MVRSRTCSRMMSPIPTLCPLPGPSPLTSLHSNRADLSSLCKSAIKKLLIKDEHKRLGSNSGASEVKAHKWFASVNWGLLRHMTPPVCSSHRYIKFIMLIPPQIIPAESNGIDAINFRTMRDSKSVDLERNDDTDIIHATAGSPSAFSNGNMTPGMLTPKELTHDASTPPEMPRSGGRKASASNGQGVGATIVEDKEKNPFGDFNSVTRDVGDW